MNPLLADPERFELPTTGFEDQDSSTELRTVFGADAQDRTGDLHFTKVVRYRLCHISVGAGEGVRTLDIYLGKVVLYQLSYARVFVLITPHEDL